jgi:FkbM family methyltransferase
LQSAGGKAEVGGYAETGPIDPRRERAVNADLRVATRTILTRFPWMADIKARAHYSALRVLRRPFEGDFLALRPYLRPGMLCVDVGANHGQSIDALRMMNPHVRVLAFEPQPTLYERLARRFPRNDQTIVERHGVGDHAGRCTMWVPSYNGYLFDGLATTIDRETAVAWLAYSINHFDESKVSVCEYEIEIVRLDDFVTEPIGFLKLDIQGAEHAALRGATRLLSEDRPVVMVEQTSPCEIDLLMATHGYAPHAWRCGQLLPGFGDLNTIYLPSQPAAA